MKYAPKKHIQPTSAQTDWAIRTLCARAAELGRLPRKADFSDATRARIKAFLGPWPRAQEAAGLKKPKRNHMSLRESKPL